MLADNIIERSIRPMVEAFSGQERGARILLSPSTTLPTCATWGCPSSTVTAA